MYKVVVDFLEGVPWFLALALCMSLQADDHRRAAEEAELRVFGGVLPNNSVERSCSKDHVSLNQRSEVSQRFNLISSKIRVECL